MEGTSFSLGILKNGNSNTQSLGNISLVDPILEYEAACWDSHRERVHQEGGGNQFLSPTRVIIHFASH
jgi:hypothetical protein